MAEIYKFSKKDGVLGWRPSGRNINLYSNFIRVDRVGLAVDGETELWEVSYSGGRTLVTDSSIGGPEYRKAVRVKHPELGTIWYVDNSKPTDVRTGDGATTGPIFDEDISPVYYGNGGEIDGNETGIRYTFEDGSSFVTYAVPA